MLAVNKLVLFILFLVVLAAVIVILVLIGNPMAEQLVLQSQIRQCCGAYRSNDCTDQNICCGSVDPQTGMCKSEYLSEIVSKLKMEEWQLKDICNCD